MLPPIGSELWQLFYDLKSDQYVPRHLGKVTAVRGEERFAGGAWRAGYPMFGSEAEAVAWIADHPHVTPTIT